MPKSATRLNVAEAAVTLWTVVLEVKEMLSRKFVVETRQGPCLGGNDEHARMELTHWGKN